MVSFLHDREIRYAAVMQRKDWVPCSSAGNCTPTSFGELQDNTLFGGSRQMNHETALGTFRLAKFWEYWTLGWPLLIASRQTLRFGKLYSALEVGLI